jgi:hypothetical protein
MTTGTERVDAYMAALEHPLRDGVVRLRAAIVAAEPDLVEGVKWNAPSFSYGGEDRITFRLAPRGQLQLVLHRGSAVREDSDGFRFDDPSGLLVWRAPDRAVLDFPDLDAVTTRLLALTELVPRWVRA